MLQYLEVLESYSGYSQEDVRRCLWVCIRARSPKSWEAMLTILQRTFIWLCISVNILYLLHNLTDQIQIFNILKSLAQIWYFFYFNFDSKFFKKFLKITSIILNKPKTEEYLINPKFLSNFQLVITYQKILLKIKKKKKVWKIQNHWSQLLYQRSIINYSI